MPPNLVRPRRRRIGLWIRTGGASRWEEPGLTVRLGRTSIPHPTAVTGWPNLRYASQNPLLGAPSKGTNMTEPNLRLLTHQVSLLNAAVHAICAVASDDQKLKIERIFVELAQQAQAALEASSAPEAELQFFVQIRQSLEGAITHRGQK